ncbi:13482_t:CDS:2, partial [Entrophospora sp. SA101]
QLTTNPWKNDSLTSDEIEQLLDIDDDMQREFELELHNFIGDIINNKKRNCPNCNEKLPNLDSLNLNQTSQQPSESASSNKEIIFRHHSIKKSEHDAQKPKLRITKDLYQTKE